MKLHYTFLLFFTITSITFAQEPATFTVEAPAGTQSVRMTGNFWSWNPTGGPVATNNGDNTWTVTLFAGGGESQSDMEYKWVIVGADNVSNPITEDLIPIARADGCSGKIDSGELLTDKLTFANRFFEASGSDDDKLDVYNSCGPYTIDMVYDELVWSDEFNSPGKSAINSTNWFHQTLLPVNDMNGDPCCWFNGEEQHYTNRIENSFEESGNLNIVAIKETFSDPNQGGASRDYTSARLNSKFAFTYGRVDVRAKLPSGNGTWPAIWTLGKNINEDGGFWDSSFGTTGWPACGEIDIMEHGLGAVNNTSSALHTPCFECFGATKNYVSQEISDVSNNFHIYSVIWSPNQMTFLVDNKIFYIYNPPIKDASTWPFDKDQYILLNVAMGGVAGTIDPGFTQSAMQIDYVRVFQDSALSNEEIKSDEFKIYPNPTDNLINIKSKRNIDSVELYDIFGKLILLQSEQFESINVENLNSGLYLIKIYSEGTKTVKKVVIN
ncbi:family 16 glycosylhydrolase [Algibacter aquimarinus]|uniref:GH16 domain-containing protein n=1 Tax=Algibacter aquimarinus TaxID=1136748 RepID=A0ABP9HMH5_9FLAO